MSIPRLTLAVLLLCTGVAVPDTRCATLEVIAVNDARDPMKFLPGEPVRILVLLTDLAEDDTQAFVRVYHPTAKVQLTATPIRPATWSASGSPLAAGDQSLFIVRAYVGETARRFTKLDSLRDVLIGNRVVLESKLKQKSKAVARLTRMIDRIAARLEVLLDSPSFYQRLDIAAVADSSVRFWSGGGTLRLEAVSATEQGELIGRQTSDPALIQVRVADAETDQSVTGVS